MPRAQRVAAQHRATCLIGVLGARVLRRASIKAKPPVRRFARAQSSASSLTLFARHSLSRRRATISSALEIVTPSSGAHGQRAAARVAPRVLARGRALPCGQPVTHRVHNAQPPHRRSRATKCPARKFGIITTLRGRTERNMHPTALSTRSAVTPGARCRVEGAG